MFFVAAKTPEEIHFIRESLREKAISLLNELFLKKQLESSLQ
jgi:hypothetical protein